jgi:hypothetical protein
MRTLLLVPLALLLAGCGASANRHAPRFAVYDYETAASSKKAPRRVAACTGALCPFGVTHRVVLHGPPIVTDDDVAGARAGTDPSFPSSGAVLVDFTSRGNDRIRRATKAMAHRGRRLGTGQHLLVVFGSHVVGRPVVDYVHAPNGFDVADGLELVPVPPPRARKIARELGHA